MLTGTGKVVLESGCGNLRLGGQAQRNVSLSGVAGRKGCMDGGKEVEVGRRRAMQDASR